VITVDRYGKGVVTRGLVVSGEYISQLGQNAARHIRNIMSKELASLTLDACAGMLTGVTVLNNWIRLEAAGISIHDIDHVITHQTSARATRKGMAALSATPLRPLTRWLSWKNSRPGTSGRVTLSR
jgi:3-oxoacyl-[acyl-carrier-protein] synthase-3